MCVCVSHLVLQLVVLLCESLTLLLKFRDLRAEGLHVCWIWTCCTQVKLDEAADQSQGPCVQYAPDATSHILDRVLPKFQNRNGDCCVRQRKDTPVHCWVCLAPRKVPPKLQSEKNGDEKCGKTKRCIRTWIMDGSDRNKLYLFTRYKM